MVKTIAVFAGHDDDTWETKGAKGIRTSLAPGGVYEEYDTNIDIARKTVDILRKVSGLKVYFPQENGRDMSLSERVRYCNNLGVDTAMFIHSNASSSTKATGAAAFYWHSSSAGKKFANLYREEMINYGFPLWSNGTYPCKPGTWSSFYVVKNTAMPVILTENFFFTSPHDLKTYLLDPKQRQRIAEVHAKAAVRYFGLKYPVTPTTEAESKQEETKGETTLAEQQRNKEATGFTDVSPTSAYAEAVKFLKDEGITSGYTDGSFQPQNNITRGEVALFLYRALKK